MKFLNLLPNSKQQLTELFSIHRERLWRTVQTRLDQRLYGRVDPDDVLQEAYLDAQQRLKSTKDLEGYSPFVWLRLIVGQTLINMHRRHLGAQKRDAAREQSQRLQFQCSATTTQVAFQLSASQTSPSSAAMRAERVGQIAASLESLSEMDREILTLRHFEDLTNKEIAELLGIEQKTASIRYVRALQRLKNCLEDDRDFQLNDF